MSENVGSNVQTNSLSQSCKIYFSFTHLHKYKTAHLINIGQYAVTARVGSHRKQSSIKILNIGKLSVPQ